MTEAPDVRQLATHYCSIATCGAPGLGTWCKSPVEILARPTASLLQADGCPARRTESSNSVRRDRGPIDA